MTPLLDWTESPFVALYFAFSEPDAPGVDHRAVWAFSQDAIDRIQRAQIEFEDMRLVEPLSDDNARLVSQRGLFVKCPPGIAIEDALKSAFVGEARFMPMIKLKIPNRDRTTCLRFLNRMNINHLTLFPDLLGASVHCNTDLALQDY